jgi:hypothetical protein
MRPIGRAPAFRHAHTARDRGSQARPAPRDGAAFVSAVRPVDALHDDIDLREGNAADGTASIVRDRRSPASHAFRHVRRAGLTGASPVVRGL